MRKQIYVRQRHYMLWEYLDEVAAKNNTTISALISAMIKRHKKNPKLMKETINEL